MEANKNSAFHCHVVEIFAILDCYAVQGDYLLTFQDRYLFHLDP